MDDDLFTLEHFLRSNPRLVYTEIKYENEIPIIMLDNETCIMIGGIAIKYYKNGLLHREDGPAIQWLEGSKEYYMYGKLHRIGGPAYESAMGYKEWWVNGRRITV